MVTSFRWGAKVWRNRRRCFQTRTPRNPIARLFIFASLLTLIASHHPCELNLPSFPLCLLMDGWMEG